MSRVETVHVDNPGGVGCLVEVVICVILVVLISMFSALTEIKDTLVEMNAQTTNVEVGK